MVVAVLIHSLTAKDQQILSNMLLLNILCVFDTSTSTLNFKLDRLVDLAALGQVKLDCGSKPAELAAYCGSVVGYVADFGTESQIY